MDDLPKFDPKSIKLTETLEAQSVEHRIDMDQLRQNSNKEMITQTIKKGFRR